MKKLIYLLLIALTMTACGALKIEHKMREVELGMPKKKVVSILGNNYEAAGARQTRNGDVEMIRYYSVSMEKGEEYYVLSFQNGKLVEWFKEKAPASNAHPNHAH